MWPNTYPSHEFSTDDDYQASIERSKRAQIEARLAAGADPDTGKLLPSRQIAHMPLRQRKPLAQRIECADALDRVVERYGLQAVLCAMANVVAANGHDISQRTIHELAQGSEEQ